MIDKTLFNEGIAHGLLKHTGWETITPGRNFRAARFVTIEGVCEFIKHPGAWLHDAEGIAERLDLFMQEAVE